MTTLATFKIAMRRLFVLLSFFVCASVSQAQTVIKMEKKDGVYYVPCTVNGLKLSFIFDTGASDVCISVSEALFMLKNGYLSTNDMLGVEYYQIANGDVAEGMNITLRSVVIGDKVLHNVKASIVHSTTAPLLLGQSVLERFGNVSINYGNQTLVLGSSGITATSPSASFQGDLVDSRDGKKYKTITIAGQLWMAENLVFRPSSGNYYAYDNAPKNIQLYGYLYDWVTANKVCPNGWHLPSDVEWTELTDFLGGEELAGSKMKTTTGWALNGNGTNSSGFSGLPGGYRGSNGVFDMIGGSGMWWGATSTGADIAWCRFLFSHEDVALRDFGKMRLGLSVRCIRD